jgi:hypothetical protein
MVSKGRAFSGYNGVPPDRRADGIGMVPFNFDAPGRCVTLQAGYPGGIGDVVLMGVKSGNSLAVGEINSIGTGGTIVVKELQELFWHTNFVRDLGKGDQKIFVVFVTPAPACLSIQVSLGLSGGDVPQPQNVESNIILDMDGNHIITGAEAGGFVEKAKILIKRSEGLSLGELAPGIPSELKVTGVDLSGLIADHSAEEAMVFNNIAGEVALIDGKQFVYFQWTEEAPVGIRLNNLGDIDPSVQFDEFMKEIRDENIVGPYEYRPAHEQPWALSSIYIDLVDKVSETMVVRGEKIKSIKRVKKCGKCYYKLELADRGFVSNVRPGRYGNCFLKFNGGEPFGM